MAALPHPSPPPPQHAFSRVIHHPLVQLAQHITSPLTASLFVFVIHKSWQAPAFMATAQAHALLRAPRAALLGVGALGGAAATWRALSAEPHTPALQRQQLAAASRVFSAEDAPAAAAHLVPWRGCAPVSELLARVHGCGLPWWATIVSVTLGVRVLLAPLQSALLANSLRLKVAWPEVLRLSAAVRGAQGAAARAEAARALLAALDAARCSPFYQCMSFPLFLPASILSVFGAMHNLTLTEPELRTQGVLWFPDLSSPDDTHLLPILSAVTWLANVELGAGHHYSALPTVRLTARTAAVAFIPLAETIPAGILLFWVTSNVFALARGAVLRANAVRSALGIPLHSAVLALKHLPPARPL